MHRHLISSFAAAALLLAGCATGPAAANIPAPQDGDDLRAFPAAQSGQSRHVIRLPAQADEDNLKVELILGQTRTIDCNNHGLGGALETHTAEGWGYDYFVLPALGPGISTLMGCPPGSGRQAFVTIPQPPLVRYNSRLPLVVYAPSDVEVRYRVWRAGETLTVR